MFSSAIRKASGGAAPSPRDDYNSSPRSEQMMQNFGDTSPRDNHNDHMLSAEHRGYKQNERGLAGCCFGLTFLHFRI